MPQDHCDKPVEAQSQAAVGWGAALEGPEKKAEFVLSVLGFKAQER